MASNNEPDDEPKVKNRGGRPRGSRNKVGNREPSPTWLRDMIQECYPREEYEKRFKSLTPYEQFQIASRLAPKDLKVDSSNAVRFMICGSLSTGEEMRKQLDEKRAAHALPAASADADVQDAAFQDYRFVDRKDGGGTDG